MIVVKILGFVRFMVEAWREARAMQREAHRRYRLADE